MLQIKSANLDSLLAQRAMGAGQSQLTESVRRLSSGRRINSAKDDAAGLGISQELQRQIRGTTMASRNANDAISMLRTADGGLAEVGNMLQRMKELSVQGANESLTVTQRQSITAELVQLKKEINAIANNTRYNNINLLNGDYAEVVRGKFVTNQKLGGWTNLSGANQVPSTQGMLRVIVTSTSGPLRLTTTDGLSSVTGYAAAGTSQYNATTKRWEMAFVGSASQLRGALDTLQVIRSPDSGGVTVAIESLLWSNATFIGQMEPAITQSQALVKDYFSKTAPEDFFSLFNGGSASPGASWLSAAQDVRKEIVGGTYSVNVQYLDSATMQGAMGAFAASGPNGTSAIFLNRDWVQNANTTAADISKVLIEELGHAIDARLNGASDTPGDEGDAFVSAVLGTPYNDAISDSGTITINGVGYPVEFAQVSVPFTKGFIGTVGSSNNAANNIKTFATLGITRASFYQNSAGFTFAAQGNDIPGGVRLQLSSGQVIEIEGAINWRHTAGSTLYSFGFIPAQTITPVTITYGAGSTYTINNTSNFGLELIGAAYNYIDNTNISGNAATNGLLDALNAYLASTQQSSPVGPVTVASQTTLDTTPTITGTATLANGETLSVLVNGTTYTTSNGLSIDNTNHTWSLTIPTNLTGGTYDVTATITNASGYTKTDTSSAELVVTAGDTTPPTIALSSSVATLGAGQTATINFTLSEVSADFTIEDISVNSVNGLPTGTLSNFTGSGTSYSVVFTPTAGLHGTATISVLSNAFTDAATNQNVDGAEANNSVSFAVDSTASPVSVSVSGATISESSPYAVFSVSLSGPSTDPVTFTPTLSSDTATVGTDTGTTLEYYNGTSWVPVTGSVTIPAGQTSLLLRTTVIDNAAYEGYESFSLSTGAITGLVTNPTGATGVTTIVDDGSVTNVFMGDNTSGTPTPGDVVNDANPNVTTVNVPGGGVGLDINNVTTDGADPGVYQLVADSTGKIATLLHYDIDGITLLGSETIDLGSNYQIDAGKTSVLDFSRLGVTVSLQNFYDHAIGLGELESGLLNPFTVAVSQTESRIGEQGFIFQTGEQSPREHSIISFRDIRLDGNTDQFQQGTFNRVGVLLGNIGQSADSAGITVGFQSLQAALDDVISLVSARRSEYGANENRLLYNINNLSEQTIGLNSANSKIQDTDFAWEMARLARIQIGQQAATAMLAQTNILPRMVSSLLAATELAGIG